MKSRDPGYDAPFVITSLTGSLLWALNYAHFLLSRGEQEIRIVLVDAWSARTDHIYPARYVTACLEIPPLGVRWHDDPYHEYFVFGDFPSDAILGSFELDSAADEDLNILVPGFNIVDRYEGLLDSLSRFQREWKNSGAIFDTLADPVGITDDDLWAARAVASRFTDPDDPDIQFQLTMMFLALRNRDWKRPDVWSAVRDMFQGWCPSFVECPGVEECD